MNPDNDSELLSCPINGLNFAPEWAGTSIFMKSLPVADYTDELDPHELPVVENAAPLRRNTFSSGRVCARSLLQEVGLPAGPLKRNDNGSVLWPGDLIGSLSHTNDWAVAAIAVPSMCEARLLGIDLERIKALDEGVIKLIAGNIEREEMAANNSPQWHATALFSIKESIYKCLSTDFGEFINFQDVEITELARGRPCLRFSNARLARHYPAEAFELRLAVTPLHVFSLIWMRGMD